MPRQPRTNIAADSTLIAAVAALRKHVADIIEHHAHYRPFVSNRQALTWLFREAYNHFPPQLLPLDTTAWPKPLPPQQQQQHEHQEQQQQKPTQHRPRKPFL